MSKKDEAQLAFEHRVAGKEKLDISPNEYGMGTYNYVETESLWDVFKVGWDAAIGFINELIGKHL